MRGDGLWLKSKCRVLGSKSLDCCFLLEAALGECHLPKDAAFLLLTAGSFLLTTELFLLTDLQLEFFACNGKGPLISTSTDCKQRSSTVSKKTPTISKKASPFAK